MVNVRILPKSHQPLWGVQWFRSALSPFPTSPIPFGERFTSPLPLSVVSLPRGPDLGGPPLAAQSPSRSDPKIHYFFDRFLKPFRFHFGSQNGPQNLPKSAPGRRHPGVMGYGSDCCLFIGVVVLLWGALLLDFLY